MTDIKKVPFRSPQHFVLDTGDRIVVTQRFMAAARVAVVQYYRKKKAETGV